MTNVYREHEKDRGQDFANHRREVESQDYTLRNQVTGTGLMRWYYSTTFGNLQKEILKCNDLARALVSFDNGDISDEDLAKIANMDTTIFGANNEAVETVDEARGMLVVFYKEYNHIL
jgi:hypothetical protein